MTPRNMTWKELDEWIQENSEFPKLQSDYGIGLDADEVEDWFKRMVQAFRQIKVYRLDDPIYEWYMKWLSQFMEKDNARVCE